MKKLVTICLVVSMMMLTEVAYGQSQAEATNQSDVDVGVVVQGPGFSNAGANAGANAEGGDSDATSIAVSEGGEGGQGGAGGQSSAGAGASADNSISTTSISNFENKTPPLQVAAPYLPFAQHGGWGSIQAYFQNADNSDGQVYVGVFDPEDKQQMRELKSVIDRLNYDGPVEGLLGLFGILRGKGINMTESLTRYPRPRGKLLRVIIDPSNDGKTQLRKNGYLYSGRVGTEGNTDRNWDHTYAFAIWEALKWDIDILLISGGMRGVTVMNNASFPGIAGAYSQANYSISLMGVNAEGITEGKAKPIFSADAYRYDPKTLNKRTISQDFYEEIGLTSGTLQKQNIRPSGQQVPLKDQEEKSVESQIAPISSDPGIIEGIEIKIGPVGVSKDPEIIEMLDMSNS